MITDSHCHLEGESFADGLDAIIAAALAAGISRMVTIGSGRDGLASAHEALAVAARHPFIWPTVGVHPHDAAKMDEGKWQELAALAGRPEVCGIGETGLDYYYQHAPAPAQRDAFARSITLARTHNLALVVHVRDAHDECIEMLSREALPQETGVIHCFTGGPEEARRYLDLGFFISFSGIVTFKNAEPIRQAAKLVPPSRILVETDAPYLAPVPHRGKRNEPALLVHTVRMLAELRGEPFDALCSATSDNAERLFRFAVHPPAA